MTTNNIKKEIISEWSSYLQDLSIYDQNKLYRLTGAFITGIELCKLPKVDKFRPTFKCYPLWKPDIKKCWEETVFLIEIKNNRGLQFDIPYADHHTFLEEAVSCTKDQVPVLSQENVSMKQLFEFIDSQFSQTLIKSSPVGQAKLLEGKLLNALYINDTDAVRYILEEVETISKNWKRELFEWKFGKVEDWIDSLREKTSHRERFLEQIATNKQEKKIAMLKSAALIA